MYIITCLFSFVIIFVFIATIIAEDCKFKRSHLPHIKLRNDLFCDYDKSVRPTVLNSDNVTLFIESMIVQGLEYKQHLSSITIKNWFVLKWNDVHLQWKPENYDNIKSIHVSSDEIWIPDLSILNRADHAASARVINSADCRVFNTGKIVCVPSTEQEAICIPDLTKYPFDTQVCTLKYASWVHKGEELNLVISKNPIIINVKDDSFKIVKYNVTKTILMFKQYTNSTYPSLDFTFEIKRISHTLSTVLITTFIILGTLTLTVLSLNIETNDRIYISCCNLILHLLYMENIFWRLQEGGKKLPLIVIFSRDSFLLCTFSLVLTLILKALLKKDVSSPKWISSFVATTLNSRPGQLLFLFDANVKDKAHVARDKDGTNIIENSESTNTKDWVFFAKVVDKLFFMAVFITYISMIIRLMI